MANVIIVSGAVTTNALALETFLEGNGHTATVVDDGAAESLTGYDVMVVAEGSITANTHYLTSTMGIVLMGRDEWVAFNVSSAGSSGSGQTQVDVQNTTHPIAVAAGMLSTGLFTVSTGSAVVDRANPGTLGAGGIRIADDSTATDGRVVVFAYETGEDLVSGTAAGRRVGLGHYDPAVWTTGGEDLFLAAIDWAANIQVGGNEYTLTAEQGAYSYAGQSATLIAGEQLTAEQGTYSLLGSAGAVDIEMDAVQGSYALSGQVADIEYPRTMPAAQGAYLLNGQNTALSYSGAVIAAVEYIVRNVRRVMRRGWAHFGRY